MVANVTHSCTFHIQTVQNIFWFIERPRPKLPCTRWVTLYICPYFHIFVHIWGTIDDILGVIWITMQTLQIANSGNEQPWWRSELSECSCYRYIDKLNSIETYSFKIKLSTTSEKLAELSVMSADMHVVLFVTYTSKHTGHSYNAVLMVKSIFMIVKWLIRTLLFSPSWSSYVKNFITKNKFVLIKIGYKLQLILNICMLIRFSIFDVLCGSEFV